MDGGRRSDPYQNFREVNADWIQSTNCPGQGCVWINRRPVRGFPACSEWRNDQAAKPKVLAGEKGICVPADPTPAPSPCVTPTPPPSGGGSCSKGGLGVVKVGIGTLGCNDGMKCHFHATYRFGTGAGQNGKPCDGGHPPCGQEAPGSQCEPCGGAVCEDARGVEWRASGGLQILFVEEGSDGYGFKVTTKGSGTLTACPPASPRGRSTGEAVVVHGNACTSVKVGE